MLPTSAKYLFHQQVLFIQVDGFYHFFMSIIPLLALKTKTSSSTNLNITGRLHINLKAFFFPKRKRGPFVLKHVKHLSNLFSKRNKPALPAIKVLKKRIDKYLKTFSVYKANPPHLAHTFFLFLDAISRSEVDTRSKLLRFLAFSSMNNAA